MIWKEGSGGFCAAETEIKTVFETVQLSHLEREAAASGIIGKYYSYRDTLRDKAVSNTCSILR